MEKIENMVFFDIDTQNDFVLSRGKLRVKGAERILENLGELSEFATKNNIQVIATMDTHVKDDPEFKVFPAHCIQGTEGWDKIELTSGEYSLADNLRTNSSSWEVISHEEKIDDEDMELYKENCDRILLYKNTYDMFSNPNANKLVEGIDYAVVYGLATDYCVKAAVLGLLKRKIKVILVIDAIEGVAYDTSMQAINEMSRAGADFLTTEKVIEMITKEYFNVNK